MSFAKRSEKSLDSFTPERDLALKRTLKRIGFLYPTHATLAVLVAAVSGFWRTRVSVRDHRVLPQFGENLHGHTQAVESTGPNGTGRQSQGRVCNPFPAAGS
jgi:hypothetical protein